MNKIFARLMVLVSFTLCAPALAAGKLDKAVDSYLKIQEALAADTMEGVSVAAKAIVGAKLGADVAGPAKKLAEAKDIEAARGIFKELSEPFVKWAEKSKPAKVQRVSCSMAKAKWLQKKGDVRNPYYGSSMLECGDIEN